MSATASLQERLKSTVPPILVILVPFLYRPERLMHPAPWLLIVGAAIVYWTQPPIKSDEIKQKGPDKNSAQLILIMASIATLAPVVHFVWRTEVIPSIDSPALWVGAILVYLGVAFRVWAIRTLGAFFTGVVMTTNEQRIVDKGPYHLVRHPSYTGVLVTLIGAAVMFASLPGLALALLGMFPVYLYRIHVEEGALTERFGDGYRTYQGRTKRLVPFLY